MIASDFNAKTTAWGGQRTDHRETSLMNIMVKNGIVPINKKESYTFCRNGRTSFIDVINTDRRLAKKNVGEKITNVWIASDYTRMSCTNLERER